MRKDWESWDCFSLEKRRHRGILPMYINISREGAKRMEPGSFQWCPVTGPEAMGKNCEGDQALAQVAQRGSEVSILGDFKNCLDMVLSICL